MSNPKVGDLVKVKGQIKGQEIQGIVVGEEEVRHHQYLDKETYLKILVNTPGGNQVRTFLADGCETIG